MGTFKVEIQNNQFSDQLTIFGTFLELILSTYALQSTFLVLFSCKTIFRSIYGVYNVPNGKLASEFMIMDFLLSFCQHFAPFADVRVCTTRLHLSKYIFHIVLFSQPFFHPICGFAVFQMGNWPQNWRFCIFDLKGTPYQ